MAGDLSGEATMGAPNDPAQFTAWLDAALGRPLALVALRRVGAQDDPLAAWQASLAASYPSVRLIVEEIEEASSTEALTAALARIAQRDPYVLLVCADAQSAGEADADDAAENWCARILDAAEGLNLFERMLLARYGSGVTRASARARGFEDGFSPDQPLPDALAILAREAIARETYRKYGSSPPCYL